MKTLKFVVFAAICLTFTSCVTTQVANLQRTSEKEVEVFMTTKPSRDYIEIKFIRADGAIYHTSEQLLRKLTETAKKEGADAVIQVTYDHQSWWPYVSGIAIKYTKE